MVRLTRGKGTDMKLTRAEVEDFLYHEADLLDQRRLEEWSRLFTEDGMCWIPIEDNTDPTQEPSLLYDDQRLRTLRIYQLLHERRCSQSPPSRTVHYLSNIRIDGEDDHGDAIVHCNVLVYEMRPGDHQRLQAGLGTPRLLAGHCEYRLRQLDSGCTIARKTVTLLDRDLAHQQLSFVF
jgi:ethylbenzene dioxygenase subunit beta